MEAVAGQAFVTGASGFIGKALCCRLQAQGWKVKALLRKASKGPWDEFFLNDLTELGRDNSIDSFLNGINTIFHVAGIAHTRNISKEAYSAVNVEATEKLLALAVNSKVKHFVYFSSVKASEANDEYGQSKRAAEKLVLEFGEKQGMHICILRPSLVYGAGVKGNILSMLQGIDLGWFPPPPETNNRRSMVSVTDLVEAAIMVSKVPQANGKIYTITDGKVYSTRKLYNGMRSALGLKPVSWFIPRWILEAGAKVGNLLEKIFSRRMPINSDVVDKLLGSSKCTSELIQNELGWQPKVDFFMALPEMVEKYRLTLK